MIKGLEIIFAVLLSPAWLLGFMYAIAEVWFTKGRFDMHNTNWEN